MDVYCVGDTLEIIRGTTRDVVLLHYRVTLDLVVHQVDFYVYEGVLLTRNYVIDTDTGKVDVFWCSISLYHDVSNVNLDG